MSNVESNVETNSNVECRKAECFGHLDFVIVSTFVIRHSRSGHHGYVDVNGCGDGTMRRMDGGGRGGGARGDKNRLHQRLGALLQNLRPAPLPRGVGVDCRREQALAGSSTSGCGGDWRR